MKINWQTKKLNKGGDAGEVFIAARKIVGAGSIQANGGDGDIGGRGGKVTIISEDNQFTGNISARGGKSNSINKWWESNWFQIIALVAGLLGIVGFFFF